MNRKNIRQITVHGEVPPRWISGVKVEVLHPLRSGIMDGKNPWSQTNNRSIVLKLAYRNRRFLLTGDIEQEAEAGLVQCGRDLRADVLKVPHHGSQTSSTRKFLEAVTPSCVVFTVGFRNIFNLPNRKVLNRYEDLGCRIWRTDRDGAVMIETNGEKLTVKPFKRLELGGSGSG